MNKLQQLMGLAELLGDETQTATGGITSRTVGKYVIVRDRNEGINAGEVVEADETGIVLKGARRLWHHKPKDTSQSWYEGVANSGLSSDSRVSAPVIEKTIVGDYSTTICTAEARQSIEAATAHAQS